jgi:hypothetical protein
MARPVGVLDVDMAPSRNFSTEDLRIVAKVMEKVMAKAKKAGGNVDLTDAMLEEARPASSPIHKMINWGRSSNERLGLRVQMQRLIRSVTVWVITPQADKPIKARVWTHVRGRGYVDTPSVMRTPDLKALALAEALREMETFRVKYASLIELADVFAAFDKVRVRMGAKSA